MLLVGIGMGCGVWIVVKHRSNNPVASRPVPAFASSTYASAGLRSNDPAASRTAATFATPTHAGLGPEDAGDFTARVNGWQQPVDKTDSTDGKIPALGASDTDLEGSDGETTPRPSGGGAGRPTFHLKVDNDLYSGVDGLEKQAGYVDGAPASVS